MQIFKNKGTEQAFVFISVDHEKNFVLLIEKYSGRPRRYRWEYFSNNFEYIGELNED